MTTTEPRLYATPMGWSSKRPDVAMPAIDRAALMRNAHSLARKFRAHFATYREALSYGLGAAWKRVNVSRSILLLNRQVRRQPTTAAQLLASNRATRRCGSSMIGM